MSVCRTVGMMTSPRKSRSPTEQLDVGRSFYAGFDVDVRHFAAMWHCFNVGQLLANDLNAIAGRHGVSIADFYLLGALMIDRGMRAIDLAATLNVSAAVVSSRVTRLERSGLLRRARAHDDRRALWLTLTSEGADKVRDVGEALQAHARFVRHYHALSADDQAALDRIMGDLHTRMDRDFAPVVR